jgi:hypothetical protein
MITLNASARYGYGGKQFIARITGRNSKFTFDYEFIGKKGGKRNESSEADVDDPGLYICRDIDSKGRVEDRFRLIVGEGDAQKVVRTDKEDAMKIAKAMDSGRRFSDIVDDHGCTITERQAEVAATAKTIDEAVASCWAILQALPEKEAKKVLAALRVRVSPPKVGLAEETPVGIASDAAQDAGVPEAVLGLTPTPIAESA